MITVCSTCTARIQVDDEKLAGRRVIRCPKCNQEIQLTVASPASEKSGLSVGHSPATEMRRFEQPVPAPVFEPEKERRQEDTGNDSERVLQLLAALLNGERRELEGSERRRWNRRKVLVCTPEEYRSKIAKLLNQEAYQVFVAADTKQAVERMRENQLDVVILDPQFDAGEQGAAFVVREVNVLRPPQRRRLFFVLLSPTLRTMDAHAAFLNNVNAVVNVKDLDEMVRLLNLGLREFNDLYKDFNTALSLAAI